MNSFNFQFNVTERVGIFVPIDSEAISVWLVASRIVFWF